MQCVALCPPVLPVILTVELVTFFFLKSDLEHEEIRVFFVILVLISQLHRIDILPLVIH